MCFVNDGMRGLKTREEGDTMWNNTISVKNCLAFSTIYTVKIKLINLFIYHIINLFMFYFGRFYNLRFVIFCFVSIFNLANIFKTFPV